MTSKLQRCPNVVFIDRSKEYSSTAGPCHTFLSILVILIIEDPTVTVKCGKSNKSAVPLLQFVFKCKIVSHFYFSSKFNAFMLQNDHINMLLLDRKRDPNSEVSHI